VNQLIAPKTRRLIVAVAFPLLVVGMILVASVQPAVAQDKKPEAKAATPAKSKTPLAKPARSGDATDAQIWGGLIYATEKGKGAPAPAKGAAPAAAVPANKKLPAVPPAAFKDLSERLGKVFKDQEFHLLGEHTQGLFKQYECWLVPSKELFLKLDSRGPAPNGGVNVHLQLWQAKKVLVKTDATLRPGSPVFIEGPRWREGRLIFVVNLK